MAAKKKTAKKKTAVTKKKTAKKKSGAKKNSLVANINRRKKAGKSRPKSRSTVSSESYGDMKKGWSESGAKSAPKKRAKKKSSSGKKRG